MAGLLEVEADDSVRLTRSRYVPYLVILRYLTVTEVGQNVYKQ